MPPTFSPAPRDPDARRPDRPARNTARTEGAVPHLLRRGARAQDPAARAARLRAARASGANASPARRRTIRARRSTPRGSRSRSGSRRACSARTFGHPGDVHELLARDFRGHNMAKAAVEMGLWALAATIAGEPLARFIGGTRAGDRDRHLARHPGEPGGADREGPRGARGGLSQGQDQDRAGPRRRVDRRRARRARAGRAPDGRRQQRLYARRHRPARRARRIRPHDDRAAAGARRHRAARRTAEAARGRRSVSTSRSPASTRRRTW